MKTLSSMALLLGLIAILGGCGEPALEEPKQIPEGMAPDQLTEPGDANVVPAPEPQPPSTAEEQGQDDAPVAGAAETPAKEPVEKQSEQESAEQPQEKSSTRKVVGAVQQALKKAAESESEQQDLQRGEAPKVNP